MNVGKRSGLATVEVVRIFWLTADIVRRRAPCLNIWYSCPEQCCLYGRDKSSIKYISTAFILQTLLFIIFSSADYRRHEGMQEEGNTAIYFSHVVILSGWG